MLGGVVDDSLYRADGKVDLTAPFEALGDHRVRDLGHGVVVQCEVDCLRALQLVMHPSQQLHELFVSRVICFVICHRHLGSPPSWYSWSKPTTAQPGSGLSARIKRAPSNKGTHSCGKVRGVLHQLQDPRELSQSGWQISQYHRSLQRICVRPRSLK